ncbi:hypothetical protein D3C78_1843080 [compost metagenome]
MENCWIGLRRRPIPGAQVFVDCGTADTELARLGGLVLAGLGTTAKLGDLVRVQNFLAAR